jgi:diacylglycerol O-acyltransferase / wax synthase
MSNVLDLVDQAVFEFERATGATSRGQVVWIYNRAVDIDGLRRFHRHLQQGRLSRRIERSPLPFGRHRWVSSAQSELEIVSTPRPREEFDAWLAEQANRPLDVEHGSPWHLAVLPFTDGGAGISLVASHTVADGMGGCLAIMEAASGYDSAIDVPAAGSRRRWRALREDARQTVRDIPAIRRALVAAARSARAARRERASATTPTPPALSTGADEPITLPTATIFVDADEWTARANALGGTSNSLLAGVAARLAERAGRVTADGLVTLGVPVNQRTANDTRANAVTNVDVTVDATRATTDLSAIRSATKQALLHRQEVPDARMALLALVPLLPKRLVRRWVNVYTPSTTSVASSQLGAAPSIVNRPDGTDADYISLLSVCLGVTKATVQLSNGMMALISAEVNGRVFVSVLAYQPGSVTSNDELRQVLSSIMDDFSLPATIGFPSHEPAAEARSTFPKPTDR